MEKIDGVAQLMIRRLSLKNLRCFHRDTTLKDFFDSDIRISGRLLTCLDNVAYRHSQVREIDLWHVIEKSYPQIADSYHFISAKEVSFERPSSSQSGRRTDLELNFKNALRKIFSGSSVQNDRFQFSNPIDMGMEIIDSQEMATSDALAIAPRFPALARCTSVYAIATLRTPQTSHSNVSSGFGQHREVKRVIVCTLIK